MQYQLKSTQTFSDWVSNLDKSSKTQLLARLARIENGNFGDHKAITHNLFELRCFFAGGIRVYYTLRKTEIVLLLAGGTKSTQKRDIVKSSILLSQLEEEA